MILIFAELGCINVVKDPGVLMENSFSPSIECIEPASKARQVMFMVRWSFAELTVSAFAPLYNTLVPPARQTLLPTPIVWSKSSDW